MALGEYSVKEGARVETANDGQDFILHGEERLSSSVKEKREEGLRLTLYWDCGLSWEKIFGQRLKAVSEKNWSVQCIISDRDKVNQAKGTGWCT